MVALARLGYCTALNKGLISIDSNIDDRDIWRKQLAEQCNDQADHYSHLASWQPLMTNHFDFFSLHNVSLLSMPSFLIKPSHVREIVCLICHVTNGCK